MLKFHFKDKNSKQFFTLQERALLDRDISEKIQDAEFTFSKYRNDTKLYSKMYVEQSKIQMSAYRKVKKLLARFL